MQNKKNKFVTSDWHIGHANAIIYDSRPFKDLDHMDRVLINNYNSAVKENDICYFLGDMGPDKERIKKVVAQLNGTKIFVVGNHDPGYNAIYELGFDVVMHGVVLYLGKHRITMSHCPLMGITRENVEGMRGIQEGDHWHGEHKNSQYSFKDEGQFHLHGHIHSPNGGKSVKILDRQFDVGCVANKYHPVSFSTIESWISVHINNENNNGKKSE